MDILTLYGFISVVFMVLFYFLEEQSFWFTFAFAITCFMSSLYGFLANTIPFGCVEFVWGLLALHKWYKKLNTNYSQ